VCRRPGYKAKNCKSEPVVPFKDRHARVLAACDFGRICYAFVAHP
jgi:hypothetical protein